MKTAVGVDGGGTRAVAVVLDESGTEIARLRGAAGLIEAPRIDEVVPRLADLVCAALAEAGRGAPCDAAVFALAGAGREVQRAAVEQGLQGAGIARTVAVVTDAEAAFHDAFGDEPGILLIAGTGSIAWGRGMGGESVRAGGWGTRIGDEGSAWAIALAGLRAVVRAADGREPPTALTDALLLEPGLRDPSGLVLWADSARKKEVASLCPAVLRLADSDDAACRIAEDAVGQLALHVQALAARIGDIPGGVHVALAGGLLEAGGALRERVRDAITERVPGARVLDRDVDGGRGAAALAHARMA